MPSLRLFRRKTLVGGDDLGPAAILTMLVRSVQLTLLLVPLIVHVCLEASSTPGGWSDYLFGDGETDDPSSSSSSGGEGKEEEGGCRDAHWFPLLLTIYTLLSTLYVVITFGVEYRLYVSSLQGTPTLPGSRSDDLRYWMEWKLAPLALINATILAVGLASTAYARSYYKCRARRGGSDDDDGAAGGDYYGNNDGNNDEDDYYGDIAYLIGPHAWWAAFLFLLASQFAEMILSVLALYPILRTKREPELVVGHGGYDLEVGGGGASAYEAYNHPPHYYHHNQHPHHQQHELVEAMWQSRCQSCCRALSVVTCFLFGGRDIETGDYGDIARTLADYFEDGGVLDVVPSDVAAGFVMLRRLQRQRILEARRMVLEEKKTLPGSGVGGGGEYGDARVAMKRAVQEELFATSRNERGVTAIDMDRGGSTMGAGGVIGGVGGGGGGVSDETLLGTTTPADGSGMRMRAMSRGGGGSDERGPSSPSSAAAAASSSGLILPLERSYSSTSSLNGAAVGAGTGKGTETERAAATTNSNHLPYSPAADALSSSSSPPHQRTHRRHHPSALSFIMEHRGSTVYYKPNKRLVLSETDPADRLCLAEGARFARHALAIYTWVLLLYMHPLTGLCKLGWSSSCCGDGGDGDGRGERDGPPRPMDRDTMGGDEEEEESRSLNGHRTGVDRRRRCRRNDDDGDYDPRIVGDNCCGVHRAALLAHSGLDDADLRYAYLRSGFRETPYCIVVDRKWKSVVLAIRGTLSLEDCVVDVLVDPEPLDELGREFGFNGDGQHCHSGVLDCTRWIYQDLQRHGILEHFLLGDDAEYPDYNLRIVGHSLGAGCATILSFMMRRTYPTLRCLCFSPPGGFLTWRLATECKDIVTSFVLDSDLVPRLSVENMEFLRNEVLELIGRIKVPKLDVARTFLSTGLFCDEQDDLGDVDYLIQHNADMLHPKDSIPHESDFFRQLEQFRSIQSERKRRRGESRDISLFPPGNIVHLVKTGERTSCMHGFVKCITCGTTNVGNEYTPVYAQNDDFNEILVSPTMGTDHFPNRVCLEIEGVAASFGIDTSLGSNSDASSDQNFPGYVIT